LTLAKARCLPCGAQLAQQYHHNQVPGFRALTSNIAAHTWEASKLGNSIGQILNLLFGRFSDWWDNRQRAWRERREARARLTALEEAWELTASFSGAVEIGANKRAEARAAGRQMDLTTEEVSTWLHAHDWLLENWHRNLDDDLWRACYSDVDNEAITRDKRRTPIQLLFLEPATVKDLLHGPDIDIFEQYNRLTEARRRLRGHYRRLLGGSTPKGGKS